MIHRTVPSWTAISLFAALLSFATELRAEEGAAAVAEAGSFAQICAQSIDFNLSCIGCTRDILNDVVQQRCESYFAAATPACAQAEKAFVGCIAGLSCLEGVLTCQNEAKEVYLVCPNWEEEIWSGKSA